MVELTTRGKYKCPHRLLRAFRTGKIKLKKIGQRKLVGFKKGTRYRITYKMGVVEISL